MNQYVKQYKNNNITTASKEQILIMLYDAAINNCIKAIKAINNKEIEPAHNSIMATERIIQEFINTLDRDVYPDMVDNLVSLYEYLIRRLVYANIKKQAEPVEEVLKHLKTLRETWAKAIEMTKKEECEQIKSSTSTNNEDSYIKNTYKDKNEDEDDYEDTYIKSVEVEG